MSLTKDNTYINCENRIFYLSDYVDNSSIGQLCWSLIFQLQEDDKKEVVEKAVNNLRKNLPIIFRDESEEKVIGATTWDLYIATWDFENQVCKLIMDGDVFFGGTERIVGL